MLNTESVLLKTKPNQSTRNINESYHIYIQIVQINLNVNPNEEFLSNTMKIEGIREQCISVILVYPIDLCDVFVLYNTVHSVHFKIPVTLLKRSTAVGQTSTLY